MTSSHRETFQSRIANSNSNNLYQVPIRQYSSKDMPGYLELKERKKVQKFYKKNQ